MKNLSALLFIILCFCSQTYGQNTTVTLTVEVNNIKDIKGRINACAVQEKGKYLSSKCSLGKSVAVDNSQVMLVFENIPTGSYCITLFHDVDNNKQLNTDGLFGMPSEPYGFSNNPKAWFGPPKYENCIFDLKEDTKIEIKLK